MFIKTSAFRLIIIFLIIIFAGGLFLTVNFLKNKASIATNPSAETVKSNLINFDEKVLAEILKKIEK